MIFVLVSCKHVDNFNFHSGLTSSRLTIKGIPNVFRAGLRDPCTRDVARLSEMTFWESRESILILVQDSLTCTAIDQSNCVFHCSYYIKPFLKGRKCQSYACISACILYIIWVSFRAFFNYITGGAKAPPAPMVAPPLNHFGPPSQSPFSLKYKQNMEFRMEVWYSSTWNLLCETYVLTFNFI